MSDTHLMLDLETLGTRAGCAILSIGAVAFDPSAEPGTLGSRFYAVVDLHSCQEWGLHIDASTVAWWMRQSDAARAVITSPDETRQSMTEALFDLRSFMDGFNEAPIWANGASFDFPILAEAYRLSGTARPWHFRNERDYRTLKALWPDVPQPQRSGTHHNALDDAIHQATHLQMIWKEMQP